MFFGAPVQRFSGSVRTKGVQTLYLPVVHSKHTASYIGLVAFT